LSLISTQGQTHGERAAASDRRSRPAACIIAELIDDVVMISSGAQDARRPVAKPSHDVPKSRR
jgi:hypothetical protein